VELGTGSPSLSRGALYLSSVFVHDMSSGNPDVTDRWCRGLQRPWDSAGHHVYILNKPEQLRGPLSPHRKAGTQNWGAWISGPSVVACVPLSTQGRFCVLDSQDSCCPRSEWSPHDQKGLVQSVMGVRDEKQEDYGEANVSRFTPDASRYLQDTMGLDGSGRVGERRARNRAGKTVPPRRRTGAAVRGVEQRPSG